MDCHTRRQAHWREYIQVQSMSQNICNETLSGMPYKNPHYNKCELHVCHKTFAGKQSLNSHAKSHTGRKPYKCSLCHKDFATKQYLRCHSKSHIGEDLFSCNTCHKAFAVKQHGNPYKNPCWGKATKVQFM